MVLAFRILDRSTRVAAVVVRIPHPVLQADRQLAARAATDLQQVPPGMHLLAQVAAEVERVQEVPLAAAATALAAS